MAGETGQERKKLIVVDFDGVIHSYVSGWKGATNIPDPPVQGALEWLKDVLEDSRFEVAILSSRSKEEGGVQAMQVWLNRAWIDHFGGPYVKAPPADGDPARDLGAACEVMFAVQWPTEKPPAWLTIDDRAMHFQGIFPTMEAMVNFKTWQKDGVMVSLGVVEQYPDGTIRTPSIRQYRG